MFAALRGPSEINFGSGQRRALPHAVAGLGRRALICVDPHMEGTPELEELLHAIRDRDIAYRVFAEIVPELPTNSIAVAVEAAREHRAEVIVAIGGGSCIDLAKLVACMLAHGGDLHSYYGELAVPGPCLPVIAVPTTAGTGSEVTPVAVLTDTDRGSKVGISSPYLIPTVAICDPELTVSCPPVVTASAGADALAHCIEAYTANRRQPDGATMAERVFVGSSRLTDQLALVGIRTLAQGLHGAYQEPEDLRAREQVMYGALLGGLAFGTAGTAAAHALQYPIGAVTHTPHGTGVGLLLPYVMAFNHEERAEEYATIAGIFDPQSLGEQPSTGGGPPSTGGEQASTDAPHLVQNFLAAVGIPHQLADIGFPESKIDWAAQEALRSTRLVQNNPRDLTEQGAREILRAAASGTLT